MAVAQYKTYVAGEVLTAADLNSSLTNITDNGEDLGWPATKAKDLNGQEMICDADGDSSITVDTDDIFHLRARGQDLFIFDGATGGTTVNGIQVTASATGADVVIIAQGSDTDIDVDIQPKGAGSVLIDSVVPGTVLSRDTGTGTTNVPLVSDILGTKTVYIPVAAMVPASTSGCSALTQTELTAGQPELITLDFDGTSAEFALFSYEFPESWNEGTITARFHYTVSSAVSTTVKWDLQGVAVSDNDPIDAAYGTLQSVTDTFHGTANDLAVTADTSAITIGGTPAVLDQVFFRVGRDPDNDTTSQDARLLGITIQYTVDALNDS